MKQENEEEREQVFERLPVPQALRVMIVPAVISQLIVLIYNMADTFYVGRTGNPYMVAGTSLILPVFNITLCLAGLAGVGGGALISRLLGQGREGEARRVSVFSLYLGISIAALFSVGMAVFMEPVLGILGAGENTYGYARQYALCVIVAGGVPTVLSNVLANLIRSVGRSREAGAGIVLGGVLNIILDPVFMFLLLPDGYEVLGAGIATCLSNCIACLYFLTVLARMGRQSVITFRLGAGMAEKASVAAVFAVGIPSAVASLLFDLDYIVIDRLIVSYHDLALAAIGIVLKVERFPLNVGIGICQGMMPLVAYSYAAGSHIRMKEIIRRSRGLGLLVAAVSITLYEIFAPQFVRIFISDAQTVEMASRFLRIRVLLQSGISEDKCTVVSHVTVRNYHKEKCGYKLCARFRLQDLKGWTKCVSRGVACTGYHTVCISHLHHHNAIIQIIGQKQFSCLIFCHALFLSELDKFCDIRLCLVICRRIYDLCSGNIICTFVFLDFLFAADKDQVSDPLFQNCLCSFISSFVFRLRQDDRLLVCFCSCLDLINKSHI